MKKRFKPNLAGVRAILLDTSALLAYFLDEPYALDLPKHRSKIQLSFMALTEFYYVVSQKRGFGEADQCWGLVKSWEIPILQSTEEIILAASRLKCRFHLGIADSFIAAASLCERLPLLTYDSDYLPLSQDIQLFGIKPDL